jgi:hypothetical protein
MKRTEYCGACCAPLKASFRRPKATLARHPNIWNANRCQAFDKLSATHNVESVSSSGWWAQRLGFEMRARPRVESLGPSPLFHPWRGSARMLEQRSFIRLDTDLEQEGLVFARSLFRRFAGLQRCATRCGRQRPRPWANDLVARDLAHPADSPGHGRDNPIGISATVAVRSPIKMHVCSFPCRGN